MGSRPSKEEMMKAIHTLLQDEKEYKEQFTENMTEEEYEEFIKECPEFLEDI